MRKNKVRTLNDPNEIMSEIENSPVKIYKRSSGNDPTEPQIWKRQLNSTFGSGGGVFNKVIDETRMYDHFFELVSRGGPKEIQKLKECIKNDPKSNFYGKNDPKHLINKKNFLN